MDAVKTWLLKLLPNDFLPDRSFQSDNPDESPKIGPPVVIRLILIFEVFTAVLSFVVFAAISLTTTTSETAVSDTILDTPFKCDVLSPLNSILVFDPSTAEAAQYSTATKSTVECLATLNEVTNNCETNTFTWDLITAYGYETKYLTCYAFFNDGTALCQDSVVNLMTAETQHGGIEFRPSSKLQLSFPNYANYPSKPSGTTYRSFINGELSPAGYDITTSISSSLLQSAGNFK